MRQPDRPFVSDNRITNTLFPCIGPYIIHRSIYLSPKESRPAYSVEQLTSVVYLLCGNHYELLSYNNKNHRLARNRKGSQGLISGLVSRWSAFTCQGSFYTWGFMDNSRSRVLNTAPHIHRTTPPMGNCTGTPSPKNTATLYWQCTISSTKRLGELRNRGRFRRRRLCEGNGTSLMNRMHLIINSTNRIILHLCCLSVT